mgnify:CR=1 FL=1
MWKLGKPCCCIKFGAHIYKTFGYKDPVVEDQGNDFRVVAADYIMLKQTSLQGLSIH